MYYRENDKVVDSVAPVETVKSIDSIESIKSIEPYRMTNGNKKKSSMVLVILCSILIGLFILQITQPKEWVANNNINMIINYGSKLAIILVLLLINNSQ